MTAPEFAHLAADFVGVPAEQLGDASLLRGLLIAAAGAAGLSAVGMPLVHTRSDGAIVAVLLLDGAHMAIHAVPTRELLLLDIVAAGSYDSRKALDVFTRRLNARSVESEARPRPRPRPVTRG